MIFPDNKAKAALVTKDGEVFLCKGFGAQAEVEGEIVFNTAMTGYQESLTDPSYVHQLMVFTFPHIGNVGINQEDWQSHRAMVSGMIVRNYPTVPSNWRSERSLDSWLISENVVGLCGIDTRALTKKIRRANGGLYGIAAYNEKGIDIQRLIDKAATIKTVEGMDLSFAASLDGSTGEGGAVCSNSGDLLRVAVIDYGVKQSILDEIKSVGCCIKVFPPTVSFREVKEFSPDGVFLSNGPGDPFATGIHSVPLIKEVLEAGIPLFGICLGHQMLALALGAGTVKMKQGHRGENHPVQDLRNGKVFISSQNHGFCVDKHSIPDDVVVTHISLFDGTVEGIRSVKYPAFSVQYHPEASPGPMDCRHHFREFAELMKNAKKD